MDGDAAWKPVAGMFALPGEARLRPAVSRVPKWEAPGAPTIVVERSVWHPDHPPAVCMMLQSSLGVDGHYMKQSEDFGEFDARGELFTLLRDEARRVIERAKSEPAVENRRAAFRVSISAIESLVYWLKYVVLSREDSETVFTRAELALLNEEEYHLNSRGSVKTGTRFISLAQNLLFTWNMLLRGVPKTRSHPDVSRSEWCDFKTSIGVRHRITHPRTLADLDVSPTDLEVLSRSVEWVLSASLEIIVLRVLVAEQENDCAELESNLPDRAKALLDHANTVFEERIPHEDSIIDMNIGADLVPILERFELLTGENGRPAFTRKAAIYMEWRKRKHDQERPPYQ